MPQPYHLWNGAVNPPLVQAGGYCLGMHADTDVIWQNVCTLLKVQQPTVDYVMAKTGLSRGTVQRLRTGGSAPTLTTLSELADKFGVPIWVLLRPGLYEGLAPPSATPFTSEVLSAAALADEPTKRRAENAARAALDLPSIQSPEGSSRKRPQVA